jgi:hypothetical protein
LGPSSRQSTVIAICFIALIGTIAITALSVYEVDDFLKVWAVVGTLVGVVTGAVPSFFFSASAGKAQDERSIAEAKVQTVLGLSDADVLDKAAELRPDLFSHKVPAGDPAKAAAGRPGA